MIFKGLKLFLFLMLIASCFVSLEDTLEGVLSTKKSVAIDSLLDGSEEDLFEKDLEKYKVQNQIIKFEIFKFLKLNISLEWEYIFKYPHFVLKSILSPPPDFEDLFLKFFQI